MKIDKNGIVILGYGPQPMDFFQKATKVCGKGAVVSTDVARMAGANVAAGTPEALDALRERLEAGALQEVKNTNPGLSEAATIWLASGERGISSNFIFTHLTGIDAMRGWDAERDCYPHDPADFRRCHLLLEQVPELQLLFPRMAEVSPQWSALVAFWGDIIAAMDDEVPGWRAPDAGGLARSAYAIIKKAIGR